MQLKNQIFKYIYLLIERGILGRKVQVIYFLSKDKDSGFNVSRDKSRQLRLSQKIKRWKTNRKKYRRIYSKIQMQYKEIRLHRLWSTRIGEYIPRYLVAVKCAEENISNGILDVFVLSDCVNHNARLSKIMGRNIQIIDENNVDMWRYILCNFSRVEFTKYWGEYDTYSVTREYNKLLNPGEIAQYFNLTKKEEKEGQYKEQLMNLQKPYICVSSRDAGYLKVISPTMGVYKFHNYRDSDINKLNLSADYLLKKGIATVRMGRYVQNKVNFNNCIDYANQYYDELMDIYLMKNCKFYVGDINGLFSFPMVYNRPMALKNLVPILDTTWGALPQNSQNILICKKYYKKSENRFLSLEEMLQYDLNYHLYEYPHLYAKLGIDVIENSAEEIMNLVVEMNERIDGTWIETLEDIELQKQCQDILMKWYKKGNIEEYKVYQGRIGAMFLRKNKFLLERQ